LKRALPWPVDIDGTLASVGEVPAFNDGQYAEHWLAKPLA
jgi:hypothetical protein